MSFLEEIQFLEWLPNLVLVKYVNPVLVKYANEKISYITDFGVFYYLILIIGLNNAEDT